MSTLSGLKFSLDTMLLDDMDDDLNPKFRVFFVSLLSLMAWMATPLDIFTTASPVLLGSLILSAIDSSPLIMLRKIQNVKCYQNVNTVFPRKELRWKQRGKRIENGFSDTQSLFKPG